MIYDVDKNPDGVEKKVFAQMLREKSGRYYRIDDKTQIFIKNGDNVEGRIGNFKRSILIKKNRLKLKD